jgi:hypothetical protein
MGREPMPGQNEHGLPVLSLRPWRLLLETPSSAAHAGPTSSLTRTRQLAVNPPALFGSGCAAEFDGSERHLTARQPTFARFRRNETPTGALERPTPPGDGAPRMRDGRGCRRPQARSETPSPFDFSLGPITAACSSQNETPPPALRCQATGGETTTPGALCRKTPSEIG